MRKLTSNLESKFISDILCRLSDANSIIFSKFVQDSFDIPMTSSNRRSANLAQDLLTQNSLTEYADFTKIFQRYRNSHNQYEKIALRHGESRTKDLKTKYKNRKKPNVNSHFSIKYWIEKGYISSLAKIKVAEIQSRNSASRHAKNRTNHISYKQFNPLCIEYWQRRGYNLTESQVLQQEVIHRNARSYTNYIKKYGLEQGMLRMTASQEKRKAAILSRYGTTALNGKVSKESLKFFVPLYKKLRKIGIQRDDILWGITGSREFAHHLNGKNYFYDFTIKSWKSIVEYNGTFWHAHVDREWRGFGIKDHNITYNKLKKSAIRDFGYDMLEVWSDTDLGARLQEIFTIIQNRYNDSTN